MKNYIALNFLRGMIENGEVASVKVLQAAQRRGISDYSLRKAKRALGIKSVRKMIAGSAESAWFMSLPGTEDFANREPQVKYSCWYDPTRNAENSWRIHHQTYDEVFDEFYRKAPAERKK